MLEQLMEVADILEKNNISVVDEFNRMSSSAGGIHILIKIDKNGKLFNVKITF